MSDLLRAGILFRIAVKVPFARFGAEVIRLVVVLASVLGFRGGKFHAADHIKQRLRLLFNMEAEFPKDGSHVLAH